jgi:hypothetical protein
MGKVCISEWNLRQRLCDLWRDCRHHIVSDADSAEVKAHLQPNGRHAWNIPTRAFSVEHLAQLDRIEAHARYHKSTGHVAYLVGGRFFEPTELRSHLMGMLMCVDPCYHTILRCAAEHIGQGSYLSAQQVLKIELALRRS